jgi:hypothetical protein
MNWKNNTFRRCCSRRPLQYFLQYFQEKKTVLMIAIYVELNPSNKVILVTQMLQSIELVFKSFNHYYKTKSIKLKSCGL